jgi:hypothetical protein
MDFDIWLRIEYMLIINEIFEENTTNFVDDKWDEKERNYSRWNLVKCLLI